MRALKVAITTKFTVIAASTDIVGKGAHDLAYTSNKDNKAQKKFQLDLNHEE